MDEIDSEKQAYREAKIEAAEQKLYSEMHKYDRLSRTYKLVNKEMSFVQGICSIVNFICTTGTFSAVATGIGAVACIPLSSLAVLNSVGMVVLAVLTKHTRKKRKKHENTVRYKMFRFLLRRETTAKKTFKHYLQ